MNMLFQKKAQEILEALYIDPDTDELNFTYKGKDGLNVKMGKGKGVQFEPYISNSKDFGGSRVVSLYSTSNIKGEAREKILTPILKALKGQSTTAVNKDEFRKWLKRAAFVMGKYIRDQIKPDAILAIKSSARLNNMFMEELAKQLPRVSIIPDSIEKASIDNIKIDSKADDKQRKALEKALAKAKQSGILSFKKIHVSLRPLLKGVMKSSIENISDIIENNTIIILDDIMTTRQTQRAAIEVINQYNPKEIIGVTLFKA